LQTNRGISAALNVGLARCAHQIVARHDADDVSEPRRFAVQVPLVAAGLDLVGSDIVEFVGRVGDGGAVRRFPTSQSEISAMARLRNPFAHPSVVFRKDAVLRSGAYQDLYHLEDYLLWARMILKGARVANVPEPLVAYRVSPEAYARRGGMKLALAEVTLQRTFRAAGFTSRTQMVRNLVVRVGFELAPVWLRQPIFSAMAARGTKNTPESRLLPQYETRERDLPPEGDTVPPSIP
jgi:glycosyltransferase involved in cell wall biosynthesis